MYSATYNRIHCIVFKSKIPVFSNMKDLCIVKAQNLFF